MYLADFQHSSRVTIFYNKADDGETSKLYLIKETQPPVTKAHTKAIQDTKEKNVVNVHDEEMFLRRRSIGMIPWLRRCFCADAVLA